MNKTSNTNSLKKVTLCLIFFTIIFSTSLKAFDIVDDSGQKLSFEKPVTRIISLAPHITEILFYLEQGDKLIGRDQSSNFPEQAKSVLNFGSATQINLEALLKLKPDVVIAWYSGNTDPQIARLKELGIPVFYSEPRHLEDIKSTFLKFGELTGATKIAQEKALDFEKQINHFKKNNITSDKKPVKVFYQVWQEPLMTLNGDHIVSEVIALCGGYNIFSEQKIIAPQISIEAVIQANPELIIIGENNKNTIKLWGNWQSINAVKNKQFLAVNSDHLVRAGPRILLAAEKICQKIRDIRESEGE